ncbi:MAG: ParB/RepB/Spo0J family partition protein [Coriobacteriia bacterium]|nr:ParB/RepB/Spo0J family partition protein [Coriobacteriia bacterium]
MAAKGGFGRGLASLIATNMDEAELEQDSTDDLSVELIEPNPKQPRSDFDEEKLEELAASIKTHGLLQPIVVRPLGDTYQIIAGERRWRACKAAGLETVPVRILTKDDRETAELALIENLQRDDLNPIEAAYGYQSLIVSYDLTQADAADRIGISRTAVTNALRLLDLPEVIQEMVFKGTLSAGAARALMGVRGSEARIELAEKAVTEQLSVRDIENLARLYTGGKLPKAKRPVSPTSYRNVARRLRRLLQASVSVRVSRGKNKIEIEFKDEDDLMRIFDIIAHKS